MSCPIGTAANGGARAKHHTIAGLDAALNGCSNFCNESIANTGSFTRAVQQILTHHMPGCNAW
jgi:hypothetical protein